MPNLPRERVGYSRTKQVFLCNNTTNAPISGSYCCVATLLSPAFNRTREIDQLNEPCSLCAYR